MPRLRNIKIMEKVISFEEEFENVKIDTIYIKEEVIC